MWENLKLYTQNSIGFTVVILNHIIILSIFHIAIGISNNISYFLRKLFN